MVGFGFVRRAIREAKEDASTFLDTWNVIIMAIILLLSFWVLGWTDIVVGILPNWLPSRLRGTPPATSKLLILLTAAYVLTSFNQMREARANPRNHEARPVLPSVEYDSSWGFKVPKLRNFGNSPAVSFQVLARVEGVEDETEVIRRIERLDEPVNLDSDRTVTLMSEDLVEILMNSDEWPNDAELKLYYGFEAIHAGDAPHAPGIGKSLDDLVVEYPDPYSFTIEELRRCFNESGADSSG